MDTSTRSAVSYSDLNTKVIVDNICCFLSLMDLRNYHLVNHQWNSSCVKALKKLSSTNVVQLGHLTFQRHLEFLKNRLKLPWSPRYAIKLDKSLQPQKLHLILQNVMKLVEYFDEYNIRSSKIKCCWSSDGDFKKFVPLVEKFGFGLKHLCFQDQFLSSTTKQPVIAMLSQIIKSAQCLTSLEVRVTDWNSQLNELLLKLLLKEIELLTQLKSLKFPLSQDQSFPVLIQFQLPNLTYLTVRVMERLDFEMNGSFLQQFLIRNCPRLRQLEIVFLEIGESNGFLEFVGDCQAIWLNEVVISVSYLHGNLKYMFTWISK